MIICCFLQLDVFFFYFGVGNLLVVVFDVEGLDDVVMQVIVCWMWLLEIIFVFVLQVLGVSYGICMFSLQKEVLFVGYFSVGIVYVVFEVGLVVLVDGVLVQDGIVGVLLLCVEGSGVQCIIVICILCVQVVEVIVVDDLCLQVVLVGWVLGDLLLVCMDGGCSWWVVELVDEVYLCGFMLDWVVIVVLVEFIGSMGVFVYVCSQEMVYDLVVCVFVGNGCCFEDVVLGVVNVVFVVWLDSWGVLFCDELCYVVSQGCEVGYDVWLSLYIDVGGDVWFGGQVQIVICGILDW